MHPCFLDDVSNFDRLYAHTCLLVGLVLRRSACISCRKRRCCCCERSTSGAVRVTYPVCWTSAAAVVSHAWCSWNRRSGHAAAPRSVAAGPVVRLLRHAAEALPRLCQCAVASVRDKRTSSIRSTITENGRKTTIGSVRGRRSAAKHPGGCHRHRRRCGAVAILPRGLCIATVDARSRMLFLDRI
jgi:hypothetical protein